MNAPPDKRGKAPLIDAGFKGATTNEATIRRWWSQWPNANIGVACGASGLVVVDVDGAAGWHQIRFGDYDLPDTLTQITGKPEGKHLLYQAGNHGIRNNTGIFGSPGVDVRGDGGYIIVAPSRHYSGNYYEFEDPDMPLADPPLWLVGLQRERTGRLSAARKLIISPDEMLGEGARNDKLYDIGCVFRRDNMIQDVELMFGLLMAENNRRCEPPLGADEVRKIAASAVKVLADEIELPPDGWGTSLVTWAKQTGDPNTLKKAESLRVEIEDKLPDAAGGRLAISLIRYVSPGVDGGTFSATVTFKGREVTLSGLLGEDLNSPERIKAKALSEKLVIPAPKRRAWDAMMEAAMAQCMDVEVPREVSIVGACIEAAVEFATEKADTKDWSDFPMGKDRMRYDHGDNTYSVHAASLRRAVARAVPDAKRKDITAALAALDATPHRSPNGTVRMTRLTLMEG